VADTVLREAGGGWVVVGYHGTASTVSYVAEGTKGVDELKHSLKNDGFYYVWDSECCFYLLTFV
jgi:hypothetical protein